MSACSSGSPFAAALAASMGSGDLASPSVRANCADAKFSEETRAMAGSDVRMSFIVSIILIGSPLLLAGGPTQLWLVSCREDFRSREAAGWADDHVRGQIG